MCSISIADDADRLVQLIELNEYRGTHSHSFCLMAPGTYDEYIIASLSRGLGPIDKSKIKIPKNCFAIVHQQAPTTENKGIESVHPAQIGDHYLWHNGIIKEKEIKRLQESLESTFSWDTKLILRKYIEYDEDLNDLDGSFACVYIHDGRTIEVFRNEISPLFTTEYFEVFSSTKFEGSVPVDANVIINLDYNPYDRCFDVWQHNEFKTVENPYYFGE